MAFDLTHDTLEECLVGLRDALISAADDWDGDKHRADTLTFTRMICDTCGYASQAFAVARFERVARVIEEIDIGMSHVEDATTYDKAAEAIRDTLHDSCLTELLEDWELIL